MEEVRKRKFQDDVPNGSSEVRFDESTLDEHPSLQKRRRHSSACSLDLNGDDVNGMGGKSVNFSIKSDSEDEAEWNQPPMVTATERTVDNLVTDSYFNQASESAKDLALKAFRRVDSTASELNCLADPKLSENVVDVPEDSRDPFGSLGTQALLRSESVGSDLKRLVSTPSSDMLSPDIFRNNLRALKDHDNTVREQIAEPVVPKQSGDLDWIEECPDWLRDDYFDKEMSSSKVDFGSPRSKSVLAGKNDDLRSGVDKCESSLPNTLRHDQSPIKKSVSLPAKTKELQLQIPASTSFSNNLSDFEFSGENNYLNDNSLRTQSAKTKQRKAHVFRKRHCSRGKMGPPAYYKNLPSESVEEEEVFDEKDSEDFSLKGRGKNWPPKSVLASQEGIQQEGSIGVDTSENTKDEQSDTAEESGASQVFVKASEEGSTQEYDLIVSQETDVNGNVSNKGDDEFSSGKNDEAEGEIIQESVAENPRGRDQEFFYRGVEMTAVGRDDNGQGSGDHASRDDSEVDVSTQSDVQAVESDEHFEIDKGGRVVFTGDVSTDSDVQIVELDENTKVEIGEGGREVYGWRNDEEEMDTGLGRDERRLDDDVQVRDDWLGTDDSGSDPLPLDGDDVDSSVIVVEDVPRSTASTSVNQRPPSGNVSVVETDAVPFGDSLADPIVIDGNRASGSVDSRRPSLRKCQSLQKDAQSIADVLGFNNVDAIYDRLQARRGEANRMELVMNDILEGNINVQPRSDSEPVPSTANGQDSEPDILTETTEILGKLRKHYDIAKLDPNEVFGLVEKCAEKVKDRSAREEQVILTILDNGALDKKSQTDQVNDEDKFLHDVEQLVGKFPNVEPFEIYTLLEAQRNEANRVEVVQHNLEGKSGAPPVITIPSEEELDTPTRRAEADPLYEDMVKVAKLFPGKDRNEIYAYLEAHHDAPNRVQVVTEEFLQMTQDVEITEGPNAAPAADEPTTSKEEPKSQPVVNEEQVLNLLAIFPDCDPNYLYQTLEATKNNPDSVKNLAARMFERKDYPRKKDTQDKQQKRQNRLKFLNMQLNLKEFLELFPDPKAVFYDEEKQVSEPYKKHVYVHLFNTFPYLQDAHLKQVMEKHKNHLTTTLRELEEDVANTDIRKKTVRKQNNKKYRVSKRPISKQLEFPDDPDEYFYKELLFTQNEVQIIEHISTQKKVYECKIERARKNGELYECQCCFDDEVLFEEMKACIDGHLFCSTCVRRSAEENIGSSKLQFPCLEGECKESFTMRTLQEVLPPNVFSGLLNKIQEEEVKQAGIDNLVSCPFCSFATIMENPDDKVLRCLNPQCLKESCRLCGEPNHIPLKCEEVEKQGQTNMRTYIENKISEAMIRTCWKCSKRFYKMEGCNKMTCSCKATMCYVCRAPNINYDHFGNGKDGKCPPHTDIFELHRQEMEKAGLSAKKEYEKDHPDTESGLKFDPLQHIKDAATAKRPGGPRNPGYPAPYAEEEDSEEEDEYDEEEEYDEYDYRYRRYGYEEEEEEEDDGYY